MVRVPVVVSVVRLVAAAAALVLAVHVATCLVVHARMAPEMAAGHHGVEIALDHVPTVVLPVLDAVGLVMLLAAALLVRRRANASCSTRWLVGTVDRASRASPFHARPSPSALCVCRC